MTKPADDAEELNRHAGFVRRLARGLLGDEHAAEDVAQEALALGWRGSMRAPRRFLATVTRRLASRRLRSDARRKQREQAVARPEYQAQPDLAKAETLQRVTQAVLELAPGWREIVLLRFYEDLKPRAIAARLGISVTAVHGRLRRAMHELRERLRRECGDRGDWRAGLGLLVGIDVHEAAAAAAGGLVVGGKVLSGAAVVAAAICLWLLARSDEDMTALLPGGEGRESQTVAAAPEPDRRFDRREELGSGGEATQTGLSDPAWRGTLSGRILDTRRLPVRGARVLLRDEGGVVDSVVTGAEGAFSLALEIGRGRVFRGQVVARESGRTGLRAVSVTTWLPESVDLGVVVLDGDRSLRVRVFDGGVPVSGARVEARRPSGWETHAWTTLTDAMGAASLDGLPLGPFRLDALTDGARVSCLVEVGATESVVLDLGAAVRMTLIARDSATGAPVPAARLRLRERVAGEGGVVGSVPVPAAGESITDDRGRCVLEGLRSGEVLSVDATAEGRSGGLAEIVVRAGAEMVVPMAPVRTVTWRWPLGAGEVPPPDEGSVLALEPAADAGVEPPAATGVVRDGHLDVVAEAGPYSQRFWVMGPEGSIARAWMEHGSELGDPLVFRRPRHGEVVLRGAAGEPLAGWPIAFRAERTGAWRGPITTDEQGVARLGPLFGGSWSAHLDHEPGSTTGDELELGTLDLEYGDARLEVARSPGVEVTARVWIDGERRLPPTLALHADNGWCGPWVEDPELGELRFTLWPHDPDKTCQVHLFGPWTLSIGMAEVPPRSGPAVIDLYMDRLARAVVRVVPPADGRYRVYLERGFGGDSWSIWSHYQETGAQEPVERSFTNLRKGTYRVRDQLSGAVSAVVEARPGRVPARLELDLSRVVTISGRVVVPPGTDLRGLDLDVEGAEAFRERVTADGGFVLRLPLTGPVRLSARHPDLVPDPQLGTAEVHGPARDVALYLRKRQARR